MKKHFEAKVAFGYGEDGKTVGMELECDTVMPERTLLDLFFTTAAKIALQEGFTLEELVDMVQGCGKPPEANA